MVGEEVEHHVCVVQAGQILCNILAVRLLNGHIVMYM